MAGDVAEEALAAVRTVTAFMAHKKMSDKYGKLLIDAEKESIKKAIAMGAIFGIFQLIIFSTYSLAFFYGGILLDSKEISPGDILTVFFSVVIGAFSIAGSSGELQAMGFAAGAGITLFDPIDRVPPISTQSSEGKKLDKVEGKITVENITFSYPSRPDVIAVKNMSL